jgi:predicted Zn-dependent peptidase
VNVNVGNFSDEDDMPGMAHAVEHLLFMGTKKVNEHFPSGTKTTEIQLAFTSALEGGGGRL